MTKPSLVLVVPIVAAWIASPPLGAQPFVPSAGLAAEAEQRWDDALTIYRRELAREPERADLWVRVANVEAARGNLGEAIEALEQAGRMTLADPSVYARLFQASLGVHRPNAALEAIEGALAQAPDSESYLRARGTVTTWIGEYRLAQDSYRRLLHVRPDDLTTALNLARVSAWSGDGAEACSMYRVYLEAHPESAAVWIELARTESWRGNFRAGLDALAMYRHLFGNTPDYRAELAAILSKTGRPTRVLHRPLAFDPFLAG